MSMRDAVAAMRTYTDGSDLVVLEPAGERPAPFYGPRREDGPATAGQANTLAWARDPGTYTRMLGWVLELPGGVTLDDITAALSGLLSRHESLRTTYPGGSRDGRPVQRVARSGGLTLRLFDVPGPEPDRAALATTLVGHLREGEFDLRRDLPVGVAVALRQGRPVTAVVVCSHLAADLVSMAVLGAEFSATVGRAAVAGPPEHQPLDQAAAELSPRGQRRTRAALQVWETRLRTHPQCLLAMPVAGEAPGPPLSAWLWSRAAALALPHIAARTGTSPQAAVLAAVSAVLGQRTGQDRCVMTALMHNRCGAPATPATRSRRSPSEALGALMIVANIGAPATDIHHADGASSDNATLVSHVSREAQRWWLRTGPFHDHG